MLEPIDTRTPVDYLEPDGEPNEYREASLAYLRLISLAMSYITEADNPGTAAWGVVYALGLISVSGNVTMREKGRELGLSSGTISHHAKKFGRMAGLPPSALMQGEDRVTKAREARQKVVAGATEAATH